jgi:hypothetical protein
MRVNDLFRIFDNNEASQPNEASRQLPKTNRMIENESPCLEPAIDQKSWTI